MIIIFKSIKVLLLITFFTLALCGCKDYYVNKSISALRKQIPDVTEIVRSNIDLFERLYDISIDRGSDFSLYGERDVDGEIVVQLFENNEQIYDNVLLRDAEFLTAQEATAISEVFSLSIGKTSLKSFSLPIFRFSEIQGVTLSVQRLALGESYRSPTVLYYEEFIDNWYVSIHRLNRG